MGKKKHYPQLKGSDKFNYRFGGVHAGNLFLPRKQKGGSIVDYLSLKGVDSSFKNRKNLFNEYFDERYKGTAEQNTRLLKEFESEAEFQRNQRTVAPVLPPQYVSAPSDAGYAPIFRTDEEREDYRRRLTAEAEKALGPEDDKDYLRFTSYHPKPDGNDCINGICGLDLRAGLRYSNPTDVDRYLSNTRFAENIQQGKEDYYGVKGNFQVGDHVQWLSASGKPFHSMKLYKIDKDDKGKPLSYHFIQNHGETDFTDSEYDPEVFKQQVSPSYGSPELLVWRPGKTLDREKLAKERSGAPFPYNAGEGQVERYFGDTNLPTRFWLKPDDSGVGPDSPRYYFSGKNVEDDTKNELVSLMNDKDLDRKMREKLHITDETLQNLKPVVFGIAGAESNFDHTSGGRAIKEQVAEAVKSDPSVGLFQIRLGSVSDKAKKAFDISSTDDLKDIKKAYIAAMDRMLEGKRVTDAMIEKGYHPELADADPYFRAAYYYNQPQRVLQSDEDYAKEQGAAEESDAYQELLAKSRLRGDEGSYMHKVLQAAYPLGMEVLDDETPTDGTRMAELSRVEVVSKPKPKTISPALKLPAQPVPSSPIRYTSRRPGPRRSAPTEKWGGNINYQYGGISTEGYKANSPDRFNPFNIIPSNNITMKNVRHPVLGIDNTGVSKLMHPGYDYMYPGSSVLELPFRQYGGNYNPFDPTGQFPPGNWMLGPDARGFMPSVDLPAGVRSSLASPIGSVYDRLKPNPFPGASSPGLPSGVKPSLANPIGSVYDRLKPNPYPGMSSPGLSMIPPANTQMTHLVTNAQNKGRTYNLPGLKKTVRGPNVPAALGVVGGMSFLGNALEAKDRNKYDEWKRMLSLSDSTGPVVPGSRGDYTMNEGYFRPDQYTPVQFGAIPYAQFGGYFDAPMELSPIGQTKELLQSFSSAATKPSMNVGREKPIPAPPPNMTVQPNKTARKAYEYYVNEKSLDPHIAAGIIGNLYQESALRPSAVEKENTGNGRGIAQWDVRDRWKGLVNWATKNKRDPYGLYTQLDYILEEPGESAKALKAMAKASTPEEAAYIFGKIYERPMDNKDVPHAENPARWDVRGGIARQLYDEFQDPDVMQLGGEATPAPSASPTRRLKPQEMQEWNQFLDYVKQSGYEGSKDLNVRDKNLGMSLFNKFKSSNPGVSIGYNIVPSVQNEMQLLKQQAQDFARRHNDPNADNLMNSISPVDGWFGSQTSQYRFPSLASQTIHNGQVVQTQDQGLVNGNWQTTSGNTPAGTARTIKKPLPPGVQPFQDKDGGWFYEDPNTGDLVRYQKGGAVVDHFKKQMLAKEGKYLVTDKGTNRTYYGYPGPDGKLIEGNFEVLTGKADKTSYTSPYTLAQMEEMPEKQRDKAKITPVGVFPLTYTDKIYGNPGLSVEGTVGVAMHQTYHPEERDKYYNNNNPADNYASYGCINCHKPDINKVLQGFGNNDHISIVDSRRSIDENETFGKRNNYLYAHASAARMLLEKPGSRFVERTWDPAKEIFKGKESDFDPRTNTIIPKKDLGNVTVTARKPKMQEMIASIPRPVPEPLTPLQQSLVASNIPVDRVNVSIVDYLNERGIDSSKANRMQLAHSLGMDNYAYTAADNINLLRTLERMQQEGSRTSPGDVARQFSTGGDVDAGQGYNIRRTLQPVDRDQANIEAERGETISGDFDQDGMNEHLMVGGQRHSSGGTPLMVPAGSFVFSDTKKMKIGGDFLQEFGKSATSKKKYTPAELAKKYEIEKYKAIILDPNSDKIDKDTAQLMLENNQLKLSKLALLQEGMKGFPNGIPGIAMPLIQTALAMTPNMSAPPMDDGTGQVEDGTGQVDGGTGQMDDGTGQVDDRTGQGLFLQDPNQAAPPMRYGGLIKAAGGYSDPFPIDPYKGDKYAPRKTQREKLKLDKGFNKYNAPWLSDYGFDNNPAGLEQALQQAGYQGDLNNVKAIQSFLVNENLKRGNVGLFNDLIKNYGVTNQGIRSGYSEDYGANSLKPEDANSDATKAALKKIYADGMFGVRSGLMLQSLLTPKKEVPLPAYYPPPVTFPDKNLDSTPPQVQKKEEEQLQWTTTKHTPIHRWTQDDLNTGLALVNRFDLKKYGPSYVSPDVVLPRPTFFDPTRQLAANQEQAAAQNMMAAMYAGPQRQRGVGSNIQGQAASNAANIIGQVQNQNVGVANQFAGVTSDILNKKAMQDAIARKTYMDELAVANQQFDNSKMLGNANVLTNLNSGITNAQETYWLNKMNEQYAIDPRSGRLSFTRGKSLSDTSNSTGNTNDAALYNYYYNLFKKENPSLLDADAKAFATMQLQARQRSNSGDQAGGNGLANYMGLPIGQGGRGGRGGRGS